MRKVTAHVKVSRVLFAGIWATLSGSGIVRAGQDQTMLQADRAFVQAVAKADRPAIEHLLASDFTWTDFEGKTQPRAQVLRERPKPAITNEHEAQLKRYA